MGVRKRLAAVLNAANKETGTYGDVGDKQKVRDYLGAPVDSDFRTYAYVSKIPLGNFYAHSAEAFDKSSLWRAIEDACGGGSIPQPPKWGIATTAVEIALWLDDQ